jgi:hypothetical protein
MSEIKAKSTQERFKDAPYFNPNLSVIIAGLGGTGSHISYVLCRQGYSTVLYDMDNIETVNIGSQMYSIKDINKNKAQKAKEVAESFGNDSYMALGEFTEDSPIDNIVFSCFDNMRSRKLLFEKWYNYQISKTPDYRKENPNEINIFIDSRMIAENMQIYIIKTKAEAEVYKTTLFDDSEVPEAPCSYKATCQTGTMIASLVSIAFLNYVANKNKGFDSRDVPFYIEYDNPLMDYHTYNLKQYVNK